MRKLTVSDWIMFFVSALVGAVIGAVVGWFGTALVLTAVGLGTSHNDMFTVAGVALLATCAGAIGGPVLVWRRWRRQSPF
jgi:hypothetical protein